MKARTQKRFRVSVAEVPRVPPFGYYLISAANRDEAEAKAAELFAATKDRYLAFHVSRDYTDRPLDAD